MPDAILNQAPNEVTAPSAVSGATFSIVSRVIEMLEPLSAVDRDHVLQTVTTWLRISPTPSSPHGVPLIAHGVSTLAGRQNTSDDKFSNRPIQSVKDFIFEKDPNTESERVACLAFYLTHYLDTPHFKNIDISRLNTEAAQRKLTNPGVAAGNAMRDGFFVQASKNGFKQLSAMGERFVQLLPDREAAQKVKQRMGSRRSKKATGAHSESQEDES